MLDLVLIELPIVVKTLIWMIIPRAWEMEGVKLLQTFGDESCVI
jgi:hypothetical protein